MIELAQWTDVGNVRTNNEDAMGCFWPTEPQEIRDRGYLMALADGVGGHARGEVASAWAIEELERGFRLSSPGENHSRLLTELIHAANLRIYEGSTGSPAHGGMATTVVACGIRYQRLTVAHVGDSRCYLFRRGKVRVLTQDHTMAMEQRRLGIRSSSDENGHILTRAIGTQLFVQVETSQFDLMTGDIVLLCSDGLYKSLPMEEVRRLDPARSQPCPAPPITLVEMARARDGSDNISVQFARVPGLGTGWTVPRAALPITMNGERRRPMVAPRVFPAWKI